MSQETTAHYYNYSFMSKNHKCTHEWQNCARGDVFTRAYLKHARYDVYSATEEEEEEETATAEEES